MSRFIRHYIIEMDDSMVQRCIYCGAIISDYRNAMWPITEGPPKGFQAGEIYVQGGITTTFAPDEAISCMTLKD